MAALLLKDMYTLGKQAKIFLLVIIIFALIPGYSISIMALVYAAMLPMTAMAYDERAKWDSLAAMMPYSPKNIVLSKYLLGYIAVIGACFLSSAAQILSGIIKNTGINAEMLISLLMMACVAIVLLAVNLPLMLRFGVEKGRLFFLVMFGAIGALVMALSEKLDALFENTPANSANIALVALFIAVLVNIVSIRLSIAWYKRKTL